MNLIMDRIFGILANVGLVYLFLFFLGLLLVLIKDIFEDADE